MNALADRFLSRGGPPSPPRPPPPCPPHAPCTPLPPEQWAAWIASPLHTGAAASASAPPALPPLPLDSPVILVRRPLAEALAPTADWLGGVDRVQVRRGRECGGRRARHTLSTRRAPRTFLPPRARHTRPA
jgi:hypothetical protein